MTLEVQIIIKESECVFYLVNEPATKQWIKDNCKKSVSLDSIYFNFEDRFLAYNAISQELISSTYNYKKICFVIYGHPSLLSASTQTILNLIKQKNLDIDIEVLPGISSLDCLMCDLRIDPGHEGIQAFESTLFIHKDFLINTNCHLVLWQIGVVGIKTIIKTESDFLNNECRKIALQQLQEKLLRKYENDHPISLYVASMYPKIEHQKTDIRLDELLETSIHRLATAYIPPKSN